MSNKGRLTALKARSEAPPLWKTPRRRNGSQFDEKREALLDTAAGLFRSHGYSEVSLNDVADILKITKPTLYYYVGSKDELLYEIVTRGQEEILDFIKLVDRGPGTGREKLRSIMLHYGKFMITDYGACMLITRPRSLLPKYRAPIAARVRAADEIIDRVILLGAQDGTLHVPDRMVTLRTLFGSLNWIPRWYDPAGRIKPDEYVKMQVDILLNGVLVERDRRVGTISKGRKRKAQPRAGN